MSMELQQNTGTACTCFWVDPKYWTTHYGAVEPGSTMEPNPDCPEHFPKTEGGRQVIIVDDCMHPGEHSRPNNCPDCGRFSRHSWDTGGYGTQNGWNQHWGGICIKHGEWSDAAA